MRFNPDRLKELIKIKCGSVRKLSKDIDVPATTIYNFTQGKVSIGKMPIDMVFSLANAFDMSTDELLSELIEDENHQSTPTDEVKAFNDLPQEVQKALLSVVELSKH